MDFRCDGFRYGIFSLVFEALDDVVGGEAGRCCVPQGKVRNAVGVQVLRALDQFGKRGDCVSGLDVVPVVHFDEDFHIALNDDCAFGIHRRHI